MRVEFQKSFKKAYKKANSEVQNAFNNRLILFYQNPYNPLLRNHVLVGEYKGCRSINITGDIRAIYKQVDENTTIFIALGSHSELYR